MSKLFKKSLKTLGLPPGTIIGSSENASEVIITLLDYDAERFHEKKIDNIAECLPFKSTPTVTWINIEGIEPNLVKELDAGFGVHPLVFEDIVNAGQRPKMVDYGQYIFIVLRMIYFKPSVNEIIDEQISLILGPNFVLSFQEKPGDVFDPIRQRIREAKGRIRGMGADYLSYVLLDAVVDNYYLVLEKRGEDIDLLEEEMMKDPRDAVSLEIHQLKRDMIYLRKQIWPIREMINGLQRNETKLIKKQIGIYLRDVYDHAVQIIDTIDSLRDILSGLQDSYQAHISNKTNEIMKVLTLFSAIFIPLTFLAGIYGMNFKYMPELDWEYSYYIVLTLMFGIGIGMVYFFKKKKWL